MHNTLRILTVLLALASAFGSQAQLSATFNWADPASLTPAYSAPTSANRYGEYVSMKTFTDTNSGTTVFIDDSGVDQQSQKARFLYGYLSNAVELRVYPQSQMVFTVPDGQYISKIEFQGPKVGQEYLDEENGLGSWNMGTWTTGEKHERSVTFDVSVTINCTATIVSAQKGLGVSDITTDSSTEAAYYTLHGVAVDPQALNPGLYIVRRGTETGKVLVR